MKTVKSAEILKGVALARGASASFGKERFNSTLSQVATSAAAKPEPAAKPAQVAAESKPEVATAPQKEARQDPAISVLAESIGELSEHALKIERSNSAVITEIQKAIERLSASPEPLKPVAQVWKLIVNRDTRGLLQSIDVSKT